MNKKLAVALSGCLALLTLSACGGDDNEEEADDWARNVCEQLPPQLERIAQANAAITEANEGSRPAEEVQETEAAAFQDNAEAYAALADAVDQAGDPPVDDGTELRENAVGELREISESYAALQEEIEALDASDPSAFADGLRDIALTSRLEELGQGVDEALSELRAGELGEALARQESCRGTSSGEDGTGEDGAGEASGATDGTGTGGADQGDDKGDAEGNAEGNDGGDADSSGGRSRG